MRSSSPRARTRERGYERPGGMNLRRHDRAGRGATLPVSEKPKLCGTVLEGSSLYDNVNDMIPHLSRMRAKNEG